MHQELRRAAADVARLQKKVRKGEKTFYYGARRRRRIILFVYPYGDLG